MGMGFLNHQQCDRFVFGTGVRVRQDILEVCMDVFFLLLGIDVLNSFVLFFGEVVFKAKQQ